MKRLLCIACFSAAPALGADAYIPAPLAVRSEGVSGLFRLNPNLHDAALDAEKPYFLRLAHTAANLWGKDSEHYRIDAEIVDQQLRGGFLLSGILRFDFAFSQRRFAKTGTDDLAIGFHDLFGIHQDGRLDTERDNIRYSVPKYSLDYTKRDRNLVFSQQGEIGFTLDLGEWAPLPTSLSVYSSQEMAKGNPYFTGATDFGWQLNLVYPRENWALYASLSQTIFDRASEIPIETYYQQWSWVMGGAWHFQENQEVFLQAMISQPLYRGIGQLSRDTYEWHLAYRYSWEKISVELSLIENVIWSYNSPDWGYTLAVGYGL